MSLTHILVFSLLALAAGWVVPARWRIGWLMVSSLLAVYWLQPSTAIRHLDFWLPTASISLTTFTWIVTGRKEPNQPRETRYYSLVIIGVVILVGLNRYISPLCCLTASRPPEIGQVVLAVTLVSAVGFLLAHLPPKKFFSYGFLFSLLILFIVLKTETFTVTASAWLREMTGQSTELASVFDLPWLGFSYLAFRLLHILRDDQMGRLPRYSLGEFVTFALFFPALTAGPIDRIQRFTSELNPPSKTGGELISTESKIQNTLSGGQRILLGTFKKFVLADSLAIFSLNAENATQVTTTHWMWVLLYAYSLRIYLDFSGYTDIAIGIGRLAGFNLPENFDKPYLKTNLTMFWNSWHITLAQWFRGYFFNPLTRFLRSSFKKLPVWGIILIGQLTTMSLIGLWHGVTINFTLWGLWHGLGLFIHNRWSEFMRSKMSNLENHPRLVSALRLCGWALTFQYVSLGWVLFALPNPEWSKRVLEILMGL